MLLALPELTEYLFDGEADYQLATEQCGLVEADLPTWTLEFPETVFAYLEADCFGGSCCYAGFACRANTILESVKPSERGHVTLLRHVGIITRGQFAPFERGFFEGRCSGLPT